MTDKWIKSFLLAADCESFTKAATQEYISTTALIQQINLMEQELGISLFSRTHGGIKLTQSGQIFYEAFRSISRIYSETQERCLELERSMITTIKLAYSPESMPASFSTACHDLIHNEKSMSVKFVPVPFSEQIAAVLSHKADLCIIAEPAEDALGGLSCERLYYDNFAFCMSNNHPLAHKEKICLSDLKGQVINCVKYEFRKESQLEKNIFATHGATIHWVKDDNPLNLRIESFVANELMVICSLWSDLYRHTMTVVESDIPAGWICVVFPEEKRKIAELLTKYLRKQIDIDIADGADTQS